MAGILCHRFDELFPEMNTLIQSENFFIRRQTLKVGTHFYGYISAEREGFRVCSSC